MVRVVRIVDPTTYSYYDFTLLEDGEARTSTGQYQTDVYTELATEAIRDHAGARRRSSSTWPTSPRNAERAPNDGPGAAAPRPPPRDLRR